MFSKAVQLYFVMVLIFLSACNETIPTKPEALMPQAKNLHAWLDFFIPSPSPRTPQFCFLKSSPKSSRSESTTFLLAAGAEVGNLKFANRDARRFETAMQKYFQIPAPQTCVLENVYRQDWEEALQELRRQLNPDDLAIIYFSGHGSNARDNSGDEADFNDEVLVTYDVETVSAQLDQEERCDELVMRDDHFVSLVNGLPTKRVLTVLDTCLSGGMYMPAVELTGGAPQLKFFIQGCLGEQLRPFDRASSIQYLKGVLLSATDDDIHAAAYEFPNQGGIFTDVLLETLKQAAVGSSFQEIFIQTADRVNQQVKRFDNKVSQQAKTFDSDNGNWFQQPAARGDWADVAIPKKSE